MRRAAGILCSAAGWLVLTASVALFLMLITLLSTGPFRFTMGDGFATGLTMSLLGVPFGAVLVALGGGLARPPRLVRECRACGYDLRGHALRPGGRCPECGTAM
jgi:hypothetical protein